MFSVGDIVICIKAGGHPNPEVVISGSLIEGNYYTVRNIALPDWTNRPAVLLNEIICRISASGQREYGFLASRFRKAVSEHDESIAIKEMRKVPLDNLQKSLS